MTTKWQTWMRAYSARLIASFDASSRIEHRVTKGESREAQILDFLESLLPQRVEVGRNIVVIDQNDVESPNFDGVLIDRSELPLLHNDGDMLVSMIESVCFCLEVKSDLDGAELQKILVNSSALRSMAIEPGGPWTTGPWVTAFAYACPNVNLSFLDFAAAFHRDPQKAPAHICILNKALFVTLGPTGNTLSILDVPKPSALPGLLRAGDDSLLVYLYLMSRLIGRPSSYNEILQTYSSELLNNQVAFSFDEDFLDVVATDDERLNTARGSFKRTSERAIGEVYAAARKAVGL